MLLGQGSGGPALAMVPADRVLAARHGWLAPLPPEGASAIVFRDTDHAAELARPRASGRRTCCVTGSSTRSCPSIPTPPTNPWSSPAGSRPRSRAKLYDLRAVPAGERYAARLARYRRIGLPG